MEQEEVGGMVGDGDLAEGAAELRENLVMLFASVLPFLGWAWFCYALFRGYHPLSYAGPWLVLGLSAYAAYRLREAHCRLASCLLLGGLLASLVVVTYAEPYALTAAYGVLVVVGAGALLGTAGATAFTAATWLAEVGVLWFASAVLPALPALVGVLLLYVLVLGGSYLTARPLREALAWAFSGWTRARNLLDEARKRRGELYRAVRALEEATFRMERMNNELVVAQHEAQQARALKARFAATVSHELRSPLNLILGFSKLMALSPESYGEVLPRAYRSDIDAIYRNSQHLVALVDDILDLSQIEAQRLPLVKDRIDLEQDVVHKVVDTVRPLAERKGLYIREDLEGSLPWVLADPVRLRQALLNLLTNAIRFTERGGITVRTRACERYIEVSVQDTGRGITAEDMPRLFQEFRPLQPTPTREGSGSGLGLSISKHLIELHGGRIWAESQEGVGTTLTFVVPLPDSEAVTVDGLRQTAATLPAGVHDACLVVHDDPYVVRVLARHVEGYAMVGVPCPDEVLRLTDELHPKAIVTHSDYVDAIRVGLRSRQYDVPVISCGLPRLSDESGLRGVRGYLVKPVSQEMMHAVVGHVASDGEVRVLLVDDDPDAVRLLERMLTALPHPYSIYKAYDGREALEVAGAVIPHIAFIDLVMPGMSGSQLVELLRQNPVTQDMAIVIVSAQDWGEREARLGSPLSLCFRDGLGLAEGARYLKSLLDVVSPRYLAGEAPGESPSPAPRG